MSIDTAFQPKSATRLVGNSAVQILNPGTGPGLVSFRIANNVLVSPAATRLGWAPTAAAASAAAPTGATTATEAFSINIAAGAVITLELPSTTFFIASAAASLEITPGQGSTGT